MSNAATLQNVSVVAEGDKLLTDVSLELPVGDRRLRPQIGYAT